MSNITSVEDARERLEREVAEIIQKHKYAMDQELKPYMAQLTRIAALNPYPVFIPESIMDCMREDVKAQTLGGIPNDKE